MEPIKQIRSRTAVLPYTNIDTDQIIPASFLRTTERAGLGKHLFANWRYDAAGNPKADFLLNQPAAQGCAVLVAGRNFGCGSSREHAPWSLLDYGFRAVISSEIADIFRSNSLKNGLLPIVVDDATAAWLIASPGVEIIVDLELGQLDLRGRSPQQAAPPHGGVIKFTIDAFARHCLLNGIDELGYLQSHADAIRHYEARQAAGVSA